MKFFPLIWSGFWRKPARTLLCFLQIATVFLIFGLLQGLYGGVNELIDKMSRDDLDVQSRSSHDPLPLSYRYKLEQIPGISVVGFNNYLQGYYQNVKRPVFVIATDIDKFVALRRKFQASAQGLDTMKRLRSGVLVGQSLARRYQIGAGAKLPVQTTVPQKSGSSVWTFDVVGTFTIRDAPGQDNFVVANNEFLNEARASGSDTVAIYTVRVADPGKAISVADAIDRTFQNSDHETQSDLDRDLAQSQLASFGNLNFIVDAVTIAAVVALLFSVCAVMIKAVRERDSELAMLKALGFSNASISIFILSESLILFLPSAAVGLICARLAFPLAEKYTEDFGAIHLPLYVIGAAALLALLIGAVCAAFPAWRGYRLSVIDALSER